MHRAVPRSLRAATAVAIAAGSVIVIPLATAAPASTTAQCTNISAPAPFLVGGVRTRRAELTGCSPSSATGGSTFNAPAPTNVNPPPAPVPLHAGLSECPAKTSSAVTALANQDRRRVAKAPPLAENANLDWAARKHAIAMAVKGYSFHDGWDTEIRDSGFTLGPPGWIGQNVGWMIAPFDPKLIESGYFDEKPPEDGHRLNILNASYHYVGIGCVIKKSNGAIFTAEDFGS